MLILPIVNRNRILNVEVKLKTATKIKTGVRDLGFLESDVVVNGKRLSDSVYKDVRSDDAALKFIRTNSMKFRRNYLISTRSEVNSTLFDVYEVSNPPKKINDCLDKLYVSVITDMRKEIPGNKRGRYLSLEKIGLDKVLSDDRIELLQSIVQRANTQEELLAICERAGVMDLISVVEFVKIFDCTVVEDATISEDTLQGMVESLKRVNTRESRNLASYYNMALSNRDIYTKLSMINKILYDKPLSLIQSKRQKRLVKAMGENVNEKAG